MKKHIMKFSGFLLGAFLLLPCALAEKNVYDAKFRNLPDDYTKLLQTEPESWDFRFRPYGASEAAFLVSDPTLQRDVQSGKNIEKQRPTSFNFSCNEKGFSILVFSAEPSLGEAMGKGAAVPGDSLELFFCPGDADQSKIEPYYQFIIDQIKGELTDYPWQIEDRNFHRILGYVQNETRIIANGYVTKIFIPWELLYDRLPFSDKKDNFWRLSVIRWASGGGQTWGGFVHEANRAGYIRWPDFTQEQKFAIYETVLNKAWQKYQSLLVKVNPALVPDMKEPYRHPDNAPRSYMNLQEDRIFVEEFLKPMIEERNAMGKNIATFKELPAAEKEELYSHVDKLMNFNYDVDEACASYLKAKLFKR